MFNFLDLSLVFIQGQPQQTVNIMSGCKVILVTARLSGGKGDVAWQHAQLFRQSLDSKDYPFSITFSFKDNK